MSDVSKTIPELIAEARGVRKKFHAAQLSDSRYLEEDELAKLDAAGYLAVVVANHLADALESATRVPEQGEANAAFARRALEGLEQLDLNGPTVREGTAWGSILREAKADLATALDGAPEPEWEYGCDTGMGDEPRAHSSQASAESDASGVSSREYPDGRVEEFSRHVMRRRKAGPWEPIKGESE